jgi:uncharacterized protein
MIAADTGYLFALVDRRDAWHPRAAALAQTLVEEALITTWPVLAETCHLLIKRLDVGYAAALLDDAATGAIAVWNPPEAALAQIPRLMRKYAPLPMDLADASLVLLAEHLGHGRILSTDQRDFGRYRWKSRKPFHNLMTETNP